MFFPSCICTVLGLESFLSPSSSGWPRLHILMELGRAALPNLCRVQKLPPARGHAVLPTWGWSVMCLALWRMGLRGQSSESAVSYLGALLPQ